MFEVLLWPPSAFLSCFLFCCNFGWLFPFLIFISSITHPPAVQVSFVYAPPCSFQFPLYHQIPPENFLLWNLGFIVHLRSLSKLSEVVPLVFYIFPLTLNQFSQEIKPRRIRAISSSNASNWEPDFIVSGILMEPSQKIEPEVINSFCNCFTCVNAIWRFLVGMFTVNELYKSSYFI